MKLARRLSTLCAALSLLLLIAIAVTWGRSLFAFEWISGSRYERLDGAPGPAERVTAWSIGTRHSLKLSWSRTWYADPPAEPRPAGWTFEGRSLPLAASSQAARTADLTGEWRSQSSTRDDGRRSDIRLLVIPYWALCVLLATPPVLWLRWRRAQRRRKLRLDE